MVVDACPQITAMQAPHACSEKMYTWESVNCNLPQNILCHFNELLTPEVSHTAMNTD